MAHHLLIAGTGRAGTSLLVRYLDALGLTTHITRSNGQTHLIEDANAGLEDLVLHGGANLPYVVKSPWLYQFIDEVLKRTDITIDGVIIPIRNLAEAASSRIILELQRLHHNQEWMADEARTWDHWGETPGGAVYALDPVDQARLLAVGFHHLVERLTRAGIPIYLIAFPRFTQDPEYLFSTLRGCLPPSASLESILPLHKSLIDPEKVRVESEIAVQTLTKLPAAASDDFPSLEQLDNIALRREIKKMRLLHAAAMDRHNPDHSALEQMSREQAQIILRLQEELTAIRSSTSWRMTQPLRRVVQKVRSHGQR